jgi:hypothetical protein
MPSVTLRATGSDSEEEALTEYICDWPNCPNPAKHLVAAPCDLRAVVIVCAEHAALIAARRPD